LEKTEKYSFKKYNNVNRFISYYYQLLIVINLKPKKVLEIGVGHGFFTNNLRYMGYDITTCDIDKDLRPDIVSDITKLNLPDNSYDTVVAFEVLEHLPFKLFEKSLIEMKRVSKKYVVLSIPHPTLYLGLFAGFQKPLIKLNFRIPTPFLRRKFKKLIKFRKGKGIIDKIKNIFLKLFYSEEHYWEMGIKNYPSNKIIKKIEKHFKIVKSFQPKYSVYHHFFVLEK